MWTSTRTKRTRSSMRTSRRKKHTVQHPRRLVRGILPQNVSVKFTCLRSDRLYVFRRHGRLGNRRVLFQYLKWREWPPVRLLQRRCGYGTDDHRAQPGKNVVTTIDVNIQKIIRTAIENYNERIHVQNGADESDTETNRQTKAAKNIGVV